MKALKDYMTNWKCSMAGMTSVRGSPLGSLVVKQGNNSNDITASKSTTPSVSNKEFDVYLISTIV